MDWVEEGSRCPRICTGRIYTLTSPHEQESESGISAFSKRLPFFLACPPTLSTPEAQA